MGQTTVIASGDAMGSAVRPAALPFRFGNAFRWGWRLGLTEPWKFLAWLLAAVGVQLLAQWSVQLISDLLSLVGTSQRGGLAAAAVLFAAAAVLLVLVQLAERLLSVWTDAHLLQHLQERLHAKLHSVPLGYHDTRDASRLQMTVLGYAASTQMMLKEVVSSPIVRVISLGSALRMLWRNFSAAGDSHLWVRFVLFGTLLVLPLLVVRLSGNVRNAFQGVQGGNAQVAQRLANSLRSPVEVRVLGVARQLADAFREALGRLTGAKVGANFRSESLTQFQNAVPTALQVLFLMVAAWQILHSNGPVQVGTLVAVYYFVPVVVAPLREMASFYSGLQSNWPQIAEVLELLEQPDDPLEPKSGSSLPDTPCCVELQRVSFRYGAEGPLILSGFDATFSAGKTTAIVGRSGSGKSTVFSLVSRQATPTSGTVRIGDHDLRGIASRSLRHSMFKASQFPLFLTGTLRENLLLVAPQASEAEMERACREVGLWEAFLRSGGNSTPLDRPMPTDPTKGLSGGERKRFVLARALLATPQLVLLDEPTSGLAPSDRREIADVVRRNFSGKTVLIVDHDMEFVRSTADFVLCLEEGRAVDFGTPEELMARDSLLRRLTESAPIEENPLHGAN